MRMRQEETRPQNKVRKRLLAVQCKTGGHHMCRVQNTIAINFADAKWLVALNIVGGATTLIMKNGNNRALRGKMRVVPVENI
jgi:hypothetical protein